MPNSIQLFIEITLKTLKKTDEIKFEKKFHYIFTINRIFSGSEGPIRKFSRTVQ